jgi:hypothetical protein
MTPLNEIFGGLALIEESADIIKSPNCASDSPLTAPGQNDNTAATAAITTARKIAARGMHRKSDLHVC